MKRGKCQIPIFILTLVLSASLVVIPKVIFTYGLESKSTVIRPFEKPLFLTLLVFLGMTCAIPVFWCLRGVERYKYNQRLKQQTHGNKPGETTSLLGSSDPRVYDPFDSVDPQWDSPQLASGLPTSHSHYRQVEQDRSSSHVPLMPSEHPPLPFISPPPSPQKGKRNVLSCKLFLFMLVPSLFDLTRQVLFLYGILLLSTTWFQVTRTTVFIFTAILRFYLSYRQLVSDSENASESPLSHSGMVPMSSSPSTSTTRQVHAKSRNYCATLVYSAISILTGVIVLAVMVAFFFTTLWVSYSPTSSTMAPLATHIIPLTTSFFSSPIFIGVLLITLGNFIEAGQFLFEEKVMSFDSVPPLITIGVGGIWGSLLMLCLVIPLAQWVIPSFSSRTKPLEDTIDTLTQLFSSSSKVSSCIPIILMAVFVLLVLLYNITTILTSTVLSPTNHARLDAVKPMGMVIGGLAGFYLLDGVMGQPLGWIILPEAFTAVKLYYAVMLVSGATTLPTWLIFLLRKASTALFGNPSWYSLTPDAAHHPYKHGYDDGDDHESQSDPLNASHPHGDGVINTVNGSGHDYTNSIHSDPYDTLSSIPSVASDLGDTLLAYNIPLREAPPLTVRLCPGPDFEWGSSMDDDGEDGSWASSCWYHFRSLFPCCPPPKPSNEDYHHSNTLFDYYDDFSPTLLGTLIYGAHHTLGDAASPIDECQPGSDFIYGGVGSASARIGPYDTQERYQSYYLWAQDGSQHHDGRYPSIASGHNPPPHHQSPFLNSSQRYPNNPNVSYGSML